MPPKQAVKLISNASGYLLQGSLNYDSITDLIPLKISQIDATTVSVDCAGLERIDSAGIALLIQWQRECESHHKKLLLLNLPSQAISLLKANQLTDFFQRSDELSL